jgi:ribose transport system ATP-binding protein
MPNEGLDEDELFRLMIGHSVRAKSKPPVIASAAAPALMVEGLGKAGAFRDVSFAVRPGRTVAIVGSFGSGREELCRAIFGAETYDAGVLAVAGAPVRGWSVRRAVEAGVAFLPAERGVESVVGGLSAARNLTLAHPGDARRGIFLSPAARTRVARDWFERLDVRPRDPELELERFSGGNQQKVALAKWLAGADTRVLILDHPLRGLDPGASETVNDHIREACRKGAGLILLADTLEEALDLGDEIIVMRDGAVSARYDLAHETPTTLDLLEKMV